MGGMFMSDKKIYRDPRKLTPNQEKWISRYLELSGDDEDTYSGVPEEYHEVIEWDNGWIDYSLEDDVLWIWTLYSHQEDSDDGLKRGKPGEAIEMAYRVALKNNCKYLDFDTQRDPTDWIKATKKWGDLKVVSRQIRVTLNEKYRPKEKK